MNSDRITAKQMCEKFWTLPECESLDLKLLNAEVQLSCPQAARERPQDRTQAQPVDQLMRVPDNTDVHCVSILLLYAAIFL